jgi:hypothetical protein
MTTAIEPARTEELEMRADMAERSLLRTLDVLAERRRHVSALVSRARARIQSGAVILSALLVGVAVLGVVSLTRRAFARRSVRRR